MPLNPSLLVRALAALCTCSLLLFFTASSAVGEFAPAARIGYFGVYLTGAAVCLTAGRSVRAHIVRWQWLSPAIVSVPIAIVVGWWSISASDFIALLFYPFVMVTAVRPSRCHLGTQWRYRSLDVLVVCGAVLTAAVYVWLHGATESSFYRLLAPAAAVSLVVPAMIQTSSGRHRPSNAGVGFLVAGLLLAVLTDVTPASIPFSGFTWAAAVWLMGMGATVASTRPTFADGAGEVGSWLPRGWWPVAAVAGIYAFIAPALGRIDSADVRLLLIGGTVLTTLIVVRQFVALRENDDLVDARRLEEARFRALIQQSTDAFVVVDARGSLLYYSPVLRELTGRTDTECRTSRFVDLFPSDAASCIAEMLSDVSQRIGRSHTTAVSVRCGVERTRHLELVATNHTNDSAISGIVLTIRDITERVELERHLAREDKMDAVGRIASGVAHEFKNLLTVILGNVDELSVSANQDTAGERFDEIRHAVARAADLSRSLLGVSRNHGTTKSAVDINAFIHRIHGILQSGMGPEYAIVLRTSPGLWPANADEEDLEHVLLNLALNARDAMVDGGTLTIATDNVQAADLAGRTPTARRDYVRLTVQDTGVGMSEAVMARAFEPFFSTKPEGRGTGLGLAFVYAAMRRIGGFVEVSSAVGKGTTVNLFLPRDASRERTSPEQ